MSSSRRANNWRCFGETEPALLLPPGTKCRALVVVVVSALVVLVDVVAMLADDAMADVAAKPPCCRYMLASDKNTTLKFKRPNNGVTPASVDEA
eukprot:m.44913 g.44913  ORF g.44913 m.44913 type:complete len:94 (+) comp11742_c0_seq3:354-635(+)